MPFSYRRKKINTIFKEQTFSNANIIENDVKPNVADFDE